MQLIIQPRNFENDPIKQYQVSKPLSVGIFITGPSSFIWHLIQVVEAAIVPISDVQASHPHLEVHIDPKDFTRLRFVVILQNYKAEPRRLRLIQWNDLNVDQWRRMNKARSAELESGWAQALEYAVTSMSPKEVEEMLGRKRS
jgi:hypothetical protein